MWTSSETVSCQVVLDQTLNYYWIFAAVAGVSLVCKYVALFMWKTGTWSSPSKGYVTGALHRVINWSIALMILHPQCPVGCNCSEDFAFIFVSYALPLVFIFLAILWHFLVPEEIKGESLQSHNQGKEPDHSVLHPYGNMTFA
jgi:hypothetical protein